MYFTVSQTYFSTRICEYSQLYPQLYRKEYPSFFFPIEMFIIYHTFMRERFLWWFWETWTGFLTALGRRVSYSYREIGTYSEWVCPSFEWMHERTLLDSWLHTHWITYSTEICTIPPSASIQRLCKRIHTPWATYIINSLRNSKRVIFYPVHISCNELISIMG